MADEKIITSSVFEQGITEIMQDIANNLYEFEEYTEEEVADLMDLSEEEVAELTRVINDTTVALNKVYSNKKVEDLLSELEVTCNKYADEKIGGLANIHLAYVDSLPSLGEDNTIYILKSTTGGNDTLNLYNNGWISIGEFAISLDNYYDKAEVDALLNDKANANEVISQDDVVSDMSSVSSSTLLSTAGLEVELNKKVNLDDMTTELDKKVDKSAIATVLDNTVTDEQVASAKAVFDSTKYSSISLECPIDKSPLEFAVENMKANTILYFNSWGNKSGDTPDAWGSYIGIMHKDNRDIFLIVISELGDSRVNTCRRGVWSGWRRICTTSVADVPNTIVSTNDVFTSTNDIGYSVSNGMCTLKVEATGLSYTTDINHSWTKATDDILPKPKMGVKFPLVCLPSGKSVVCTIDRNNKNLKVCGTIPSGTTGIYGSVSYPVAE